MNKILVEKQDVVDEVELHAHRAYAGTMEQAVLMLALRELEKLPEENFNEIVWL